MDGGWIDGVTSASKPFLPSLCQAARFQGECQGRLRALPPAVHNAYRLYISDTHTLIIPPPTTHLSPLQIPFTVHPTRQSASNLQHKLVHQQCAHAPLPQVLQRPGTRAPPRRTTKATVLPPRRVLHRQRRRRSPLAINPHPPHLPPPPALAAHRLPRRRSHNHHRDRRRRRSRHPASQHPRQHRQHPRLKGGHAHAQQC
ncbi:hypothetical protein EDC01DRAFT_647491 [Geopyxis carbonaria]|nr:hypothetical protein EDC01DRAFT_647491 [Geopyxis carbonaria]